MKQKLWLFLLLGCIALSTAVPVWAESKSPLLVPHDDMLDITYRMPDPHDTFWIAVRDAARAGRIVKVMHTVSISRVTSLLGGRVASKTYTEYVRYNVFENTYSYGTDLKSLRETASEDTVRQSVLSLDNMPFIKADALTTGDEYTLTVRLDIGEAADRNGWLEYLMIPGWFGTSLEQSFVHVAR